MRGFVKEFIIFSLKVVVERVCNFFIKKLELKEFEIFPSKIIVEKICTFSFKNFN